MIFRKKKASGAPIPIGKIQEMNSMGMSDKDIIKRLKQEGYSYEDIERAMLQAVKEGVEEEPPRPGPAMREVPPAMEDTFSGGASTLEDVYGTETPVETSEISTTIPELAGIPEEEIDIPESDVIVEELVEGVIDEKWQKFTDKMEKFEDRVDSLRVIIKQLEDKIELEKKEIPTKELEGRLTEQSARMEDLEARIGGLEKAFRQFLPSLTRNIENLSNIIHEMKEKVPVA